MRFHCLIESVLHESGADDKRIQSAYYGDYSVDYSPLAEKWVVRKNLEFVSQFDQLETAIEEAKKLSGSTHENENPGDLLKTVDYTSPVSAIAGSMPPPEIGSGGMSAMSGSGGPAPSPSVQAPPPMVPQVAPPMAPAPSGAPAVTSAAPSV